MVRQLFLLSLLLGTACASPNADAIFDTLADADLSDPEVVAAFGQGATAPNVVQFALQTGQAFEPWAAPEAGCPSYTETPDGYILRGDCVSDNGLRFVGELSVSRRPASGPLAQVTFEAWEFGYQVEYYCSGPVTISTITHGVVETWGERFHIDLMVENTIDDPSCQPLFETGQAARYDGRVRSRPGPDGLPLQIWSGQGEFALDQRGKVQTRTDDAIVSNCPSGPVDGVTTLQARGMETEVEHGACGGLEWLEP